MSGSFHSHFTPSLMSAEALEAVFVQRHTLAGRLVDLVRESTTGKARHHSLLIGPRGIGKTHLISLLYHRVVGDQDLSSKLRVAWLREEEWGVSSFLDLLLRIARALDAEYGDASLAAQTEALFELSPPEAQEAAAEMLEAYLGDRTLLLLTENLDDIFRGMGTDGQQRLRAHLQDNATWSIVATSQTLFGGVSLRKSPFYGFFRIQHLQELSLEEARELLSRIASSAGDEDLVAYLGTPMGRARIRAVHHLAGGNHRVYVIFSRFLTRDALDQLVEPFLCMLDELTPYYQERMKFISVQQRKIVELLCNTRPAIPVKEIAKRCFVTHQVASGQLKQLRDRGYVRSVKVGRESYYELREPLMRLCVDVKRDRAAPIRLFVDFLRLWYTRVELKGMLEGALNHGGLEVLYLTAAVEDEGESSSDPRVDACLEDFDNHMRTAEFELATDAAEELIAIRGEAQDFVRQSRALLARDDIESSLRAAEDAIDREATLVEGWTQLSLVRTKQQDWQAALKSSQKALELAPDHSVSLFIAASANLLVRGWEEGCVALNRALQVSDSTQANDMASAVAVTALFASRLLTPTTNDAETRKRRDEILELARNTKREAALEIGIGLLSAVLVSPAVSVETAKAWTLLWTEAAEAYPFLARCIRTAGVAYRWKRDQERSVLLELPAEERLLLERTIEQIQQRESDP